MTYGGHMKDNLKATRLISSTEGRKLHAVIFSGEDKPGWATNTPMNTPSLRATLVDWLDENNIKPLGIQPDGVIFGNLDDATLTYLAFA